MTAMDELIAAIERLVLAAERRDISTGCAISVMTARTELASAAKAARSALAKHKADSAPQPGDGR